MSGDLLTPTEDDQSPLFEGTDDHGVYDDGFKRIRELSHHDAEAGLGAAAPKQLSSEDIGAAEAAAVSGASTEEASAPPVEMSNFNFKGGKRAFNTKGLVKNKWLWAGGGGGVIVVVGLLLLFLLIGQLKVVSFANILSAAGYARFNGIFQERTTQDIFDASVSQGEGTTALQGRTLIDRLKFRNLDDQLAQLGRQDQLKLQYKDGELQTVQIGDKNISLDGLTKELGFGDSYQSASVTERLRVRYEFTQQTETVVNDTFALEPGYLRGRIFGTISDNVGFSFSRWRQAARDYFGKTPAEADVQNKVETAQEVGGDSAITVGADAIDTPSKAVKNADKLKSFLESNGGEFDQQKFVASVAKDTELAGKIGDIAGAVAPAVIVVSLACMTHQAFDKIPQIYNQNVQEAKKQGLELLAARDQTKAGGVVSEAVGAASHQLDGAEQSPYYQAATGQPISTGNIPNIQPKVSPALQKALGVVTNPINIVLPGASAIPGASSLGGDFCNALLSPSGAIVFGGLTVVASAIVGFLTGGGSAAAEEGGSWIAIQAMVTALKDAVFETATGLVSAQSLATVGLFTAYSFGLQYVVDMLAGTSISGAQSSSDYYTTAAMGTMLEQNTQLQTLYGKPVSATEAGQTDQKYVLINQRSEANKSVFSRYLATSNPYSLATLAITRMPSTFAALTYDARSALIHIGSVFQPQSYFYMLSRPVGPAAYAASNFDPYRGATQIGFSPDELQKIETDPTYSITENTNYISQDQIAKYDSNTTLAKCFDPTTSPYELANLQSGDGPCSEQALSQDSIFRYRLYKFDNIIADQLNQKLANAPVSTSN